MARKVAMALMAAMLAIGGTIAAQKPAQPTIDVFKSPTCGCCSNWVQHLRRAGFTARTTDVDDMTTIKAKHKIPGRAQSCHTAVVEGYFIEGHVPVADVQRLLKERPNIAGLAVPGMPIGSPGMEGANPQKYDVLAIDKQGSARVYATHGP